MCVTREHDDRSDFVATYLIVENLSIRVCLITKLNQSMAADYCEVLELGMMPMLTLGDSWL